MKKFCGVKLLLWKISRKVAQEYQVLLTMFETQINKQELLLSIFWSVCSCMLLKETLSKTITANVDDIANHWSNGIPFKRYETPLDNLHGNDKDRKSVEVRYEIPGRGTTTVRNSELNTENILNGDTSNLRNLAENLKIQILELDNLINQQVEEMNNLRFKNDKLNVVLKEHKATSKELISENIQLGLNLMECEMNGKPAVMIRGLKEQMMEDYESVNWHKSVNLMKSHLNHSTQAYEQLMNITDYLNYPLRVTRRGYVELLQLLLYNGLTINTGYSDSKFTMLHWAAMYGQYNIAQLLILQGADVNVRDKWGYTPLHNAAFKGHLRIVQLLVESGADINVTTNVVWTPLHFAAHYGHKSVVQWLVDNGCDTTIRNKEAQTARDVSSIEEIKEIIKEK